MRTFYILILHLKFKPPIIFLFHHIQSAGTMGHVLSDIPSVVPEPPESEMDVSETGLDMSGE